MKTVYLAHKIIRDLFSRKPDDRNIECIGLLLDDPIECRKPIGCDSWARPSSKIEGFSLDQEDLQ